MTLHARKALGPTLFILGLLLVWGPLQAASAAEFGISDFSVRMLDAEGNPENRSGAHPDRLQIAFAFETEGSGTSVKDLAIELPPGFAGDPSAVPACPRQAHEEGEECPSESQVGIIRFGSTTELPLFALEPEAGQVAAFTSKAGVSIPFQMKVRPDDFGITMEAEDLAEGTPTEEQVELWGIPADHQEPPAAPPRPFLTVPSVCGPLAFTLRSRSREEGAAWLSAGAEAGPLVGCEGLSFAPQLNLQLSNPVADSPTGVQMVMSVPEVEGELASAQMKDVTVELPSGLTVSPGGAVGLALCSDAQLGLGSESAPSCPAASKVGTVRLTSAMLPEPLVGTIYLGEPQGAERFRFFIFAPGPGGINLKFVTGLQPDSATGRLATTLHDLPPVAISQIAMNLNGGPAGLLASPLACGPAQGQAGFVPYGGGPSVAATSTVAIASTLPGLTCPGPLPFSPQLLISATSQRAGGPSAITTILHRQGGEALPSRFSFTLPAGLSASLGSVQPCPDSQATGGNCPPASRLGSVRLAVGSGPVPPVLSGRAYLAGPYRHAPFSMAMAVPATIGPFSLGTVAFRAAMQIDGRSGRVSVASDSLPSVVGGIPIRLQALSLSLDRPGFVRNPTSCGPHTLDASLESREGATATLSSAYRVSGCKRLGFKPRLQVALVAARRPHRHEQVGLRVSTHFRRADASLRSLFVSMPPALKLGIGKLKELCSRPDARRNLCSPGTKIGTARAHTPLLGKKALTGAIYIVQPRGDGEPDIWVALSGGGVNISIRGTTENEHGRFATRMAGLPDVPLSDFTMRLGSPGNSLLSLDANPCARGRAHRLEAELRAGGQNGAKHSSQVAIASGASCGSAGPR